jgi:hypothetical protein
MIRTQIIMAGSYTELNEKLEKLKEFGWLPTGKICLYRTKLSFTIAQLAINSAPQGTTLKAKAK